MTNSTSGMPGVDGILFDEAGFDYGDAVETDTDKRTRLITITNHAHTLDLKVMVNAWDPDDIFTKISESPVPFVSGDSFLLESYIYAANLPTNDSIILTNSGSFSEFINRVHKAKTSKPTEVELWGVSTTGESTASFNPNHWSNVVAMAWGHNLTGVGWGTKDFSSTDNAMPFRAIPNNLLNLQFNSSTPDASSLSISVTNQEGVIQNLNPQFTLSP